MSSPWVCLPTSDSKAMVCAIKPHNSSWRHLLAATSSNHHPRQRRSSGQPEASKHTAGPGTHVEIDSNYGV